MFSSHSQLYLAQLIRKHRIDPLPIMDVQSCMQEVRRLGISMPYRDAYDDDPKYKVICEQVMVDREICDSRSNSYFI